MQTFQSAALRLSKISLSTRSIYGIAGAAVLLTAASIGAMVWKNRQKAATPNATQKETDDETRRPQDASASTVPQDDQPAEHPHRDQEAQAGAPAPAHRPEPSAIPSLTDPETFFSLAVDLASPIMVSVAKSPQKNWANSLESIAKAKVFKTAEPRVMTKTTNGDQVLVFPIVLGASVLLVKNTQSGLRVGYLVDGQLLLEKFDPKEASELSAPCTVRDQALRYVYEKVQELIKVREGKIHPMMAYPRDFRIDGLNATQSAIKKVGDQTAERAFFDRLYNESGLTVENPWTRSNAAYVSAVLNSAVVPPALEPVRHGNLDGDRFIHVSDPSGLCNLVLVHRSTGIVQIVRANTVEASLSLRAVPGFEGWYDYTNSVFDLRNDEHRRVAFFINQAAAQSVLEQTA